MQVIILNTAQTALVTVTPVDVKGRNSKVEATSLVYSSSDESIFTVETNSESDNIVYITPVSEGAAELIVMADADLTEGVKMIEQRFPVNVSASMATGFSIASVVND